MLGESQAVVAISCRARLSWAVLGRLSAFESAHILRLLSPQGMVAMECPPHTGNSRQSSDGQVSASGKSATDRTPHQVLPCSTPSRALASAASAAGPPDDGIQHTLCFLGTKLSYNTAHCPTMCICYSCRWLALIRKTPSQHAERSLTCYATHTPQAQSGCDAAAFHSPLDVSISRVGLLTTCFTVTSNATSCNPYFTCCTPDALTQMDQLQIYTGEWRCSCGNYQRHSADRNW